jgi:hypothetical protein
LRRLALCSENVLTLLLFNACLGAHIRTSALVASPPSHAQPLNSRPSGRGVNLAGSICLQTMGALISGTIIFLVLGFLAYLVVSAIFRNDKDSQAYVSLSSGRALSWMQFRMRQMPALASRCALWFCLLSDVDAPFVNSCSRGADF